MKKIILNVDDFGLTKGVNDAVFELNKHGLVKSTTALVNSPYFAEGVSEARNYNLGIGIHLTIDLFEAQIYDSTICDEHKKFYTAKTHSLTRKLDSEVIYCEWKAQIEKFIEIAGFKPTHIDSHHHVHLRNDDAKIAAKRLGAEYDLIIRNHQTDKYTACCADGFYGEGVCPDLLISTVNKLLNSDANYLEVMMHPAFVDDQLMQISSYNIAREQELEAIKSEEFKTYIVENNIELTNFTKSN